MSIISNTTSPIIMVDRGECSFVEKTRFIQEAGGQIALIVNHVQDYDSIFSITDDGTGEDIKITTILIPEVEGEILKEYIKKGEELILNINYKLEEVEKTSSVRLFFNPADMNVYKLLKDMSLFYNTRYFKFNPIYSFDLSKDDDEFKNYLISQNRCMCNNKYCEDFELVEGRKGTEILQEAIRQKCIFLVSNNQDNDELFGMQDNKLSLYFSYMNEFHDSCARHSNFTTQCSEDTLKKITNGHNYHPLIKQIGQCYLLSFNMPENKKTFTTDDDLFTTCKSNIHLDENTHFINKLSRKALPLLYINDNIFYGRWNSNKIFNAICSTLSESSQPEICRKLSLATNNQIVGERTPKLDEEKSLIATYTLIVLGLLGLISLIFLMLYFCRRFFKKKKLLKDYNWGKDLEKKIDSTVIDYIQLKLNNDTNIENIGKNDMKSNMLEHEDKKENNSTSVSINSEKDICTLDQENTISKKKIEFLNEL
jgi:hypothetical protein